MLIQYVILVSSCSDDIKRYNYIIPQYSYMNNGLLKPQHYSPEWRSYGGEPAQKRLQRHALTDGRRTSWTDAFHPRPSQQAHRL